MTTHEVARKLLEGPDVRVMLVDWEEHLAPKELEANGIVYPLRYTTSVRDEARPGYWRSVLHEVEAVGLKAYP